MISTLLRINSVASGASAVGLPLAERRISSMFRPSSYPRSCKPSRSPLIKVDGSGYPKTSTPIFAILFCPASTHWGQAVAAPLISTMKSRRCIEFLAIASSGYYSSDRAPFQSVPSADGGYSKSERATRPTWRGPRAWTSRPVPTVRVTLPAGPTLSGWRE